MTTHPGIQYPKTRALLETAGIDPERVSVNGITLDGYITFARKGQMLKPGQTWLPLENDYPVMIFNEWPEGVDFEQIVATRREEHKYRP